jgi:hypothetical protein
MFDSPAFQHLLERLAEKASHDPADAEVRLAVQVRARDACEYCLMPTRSLFEVDHIVPVSRWREYLDGRFVMMTGGDEHEPNHLTNFAWSCSYCNLAKGNRVSGRIKRRTVRLFNPRRDQWNEHFGMTGRHVLIKGLTSVGQATEQVLAFNDARLNGPLVARHKAILDGIYPPAWARPWGF